MLRILAQEGFIAVPLHGFEFIDQPVSPLNKPPGSPLGPGRHRQRHQDTRHSCMHAGAKCRQPDQTANQEIQAWTAKASHVQDNQ